MPKYIDVAHELLDKIAALPPQHKLPSLRTLADHYGTTLATLQRAYAHLRDCHNINVAAYRSRPHARSPRASSHTFTMAARNKRSP